MITANYIYNKIENKTKNVNFNDKAAVLLPLIHVKNQLQLLFEVRSATLKWQPGDICFPGGRMESIDHSITDTALRETHEELGIARESIKVYGQLSPFVANMGLIIYPIVGELTSQQLNINQDEVATTFTVPIEWFMNNKPLQSTLEIGHKPVANFPFHLLPNYTKIWQKRAQRDIYIYHYQDRVIWGLTAHIIQLFLAAIE